MLNWDLIVILYTSPSLMIELSPKGLKQAALNVAGTPSAVHLFKFGKNVFSSADIFLVEPMNRGDVGAFFMDKYRGIVLAISSGVLGVVELSPWLISAAGIIENDWRLALAPWAIKTFGEYVSGLCRQMIKSGDYDKDFEKSL